MTTGDGNSKELDDEVVQSAPPGTPSWSLGITFVLATFLSSFVAVYLAVSPDLQKWIEWKKTESKDNLEATKELSNKSTESILSIVATYTAQIADISKNLGTLESDKKDLEYKVAELEKSVDGLKENYSFCRKQLDACDARCPAGGTHP